MTPDSTRLLWVKICFRRSIFKFKLLSMYFYQRNKTNETTLLYSTQNYYTYVQYPYLFIVYGQNIVFFLLFFEFTHYIYFRSMLCIPSCIRIWNKCIYVHSLMYNRTRKYMRYRMWCVCYYFVMWFCFSAILFVVKEVHVARI